jgi:transposase
LTKAYILFLARWARRLSWKETAECFRTSWDKVFDAVEHVVAWGLEHRTFGQIGAIFVDEIQYAKGRKYLTLVYQIDIGITRLLWVGRERTIESFQGFFTTMGQKVISTVSFICSDMWEPYLKAIREKCSEALHILDRFHIVAKMNKALDEVRTEETRRMKREGRDPVLFLDEWCRQTMRFRIEPMKKTARSLCQHRELILNYFRAGKLISSGVVERLKNKAKVTMRKSYGFRTYRVLELTLYHSLGKLPEPESTHDFF